MNSARILVGHPYWGRGGAEIAAMWLLQALSAEGDVSIVTRGGWNLSELNHCAGTRIPAGRLREVRLPVSSLMRLTTGGALWDGLYRRFCRSVARSFDLCVTASRVLNWGKPAVHFLSDVVWNDALRRRYGAEGAVSAGRLRAMLAAAGGRLAGQSPRLPTHHDLFVANSQWTRQVSAEFCSRAPVVIYPPVPGNPHRVPWDRRLPDFICLGRISPEKRIEQVVEILRRVRARGLSFRLHLVGTPDGSAYGERMLNLVGREGDWIEYHGAIHGDAKLRFLSQCRYGISACQREAFGIATAEMVASGMIPFVPAAGGQKEIVGAPELLYTDPDEAVERISGVIACTERQFALRAALQHRAAAFDPNTFSQTVRQVVAEELLAQSNRS